MSDYEVGKKAAAIKAVETHIKSGDLVGIGSGSTIVYAVDRLAELVSNGTLTDIQCVPTSFQVSEDLDFNKYFIQGRSKDSKPNAENCYRNTKVLK